MDGAILRAFTALYRFPGDYMLRKEISRSLPKNEKEHKLLFKKLFSPMLIGRITAVTFASAILTGILKDLNAKEEILSPWLLSMLWIAPTIITTIQHY